MAKKSFECLGFYGEGGTYIGTGTQSKLVAKFTTPAGGFSAHGAYVRPYTGGGGSQRFVIYDDDAGEPDVLVDYTPNFTGWSPGGDWVIGKDFSSPVALAGSTPYWIGLHVDTTGDNVSAVTGGSSTIPWRRGTDTFSDGPSDPWGSTANSGTNDLSFWLRNTPFVEYAGIYVPGNQTYVLNADNKLAMGCYAVCGSDLSFSAKTLWVYIQNFTVGAQIRLALYTCTDWGSPTDLVRETSVITGDGTSGWFGGEITPITVDNTNYTYLAVHTDTNITLHYRDDGGYQAWAYNSDAFSGGISDPFGSATEDYDQHGFLMHISEEDAPPEESAGGPAILIARQ